MIRLLPVPGLPIGAALTLVCVLVGAAAVLRAADDEVIESLPAVDEESGSNLHPLERQFDQTVFSDQPGWVLPNAEDDGQTVVSGPDVLAAAARLADNRLAALERGCGLSPSQVRALRLAMESDIRRMAEEIGRARSKYEGVVVDLNDPAGQQRFNLAQQEAVRSRERVKTLFETGSLFRKALGTVLDEAQVGRLAGSRDRQRALLWKSLVLTAMLELDERLGLNQSQADAIERLLLEKTPPLRVENPPADLEQEHVQQAIVFAILAEVDPKRLKAAVSSRQWRALSRSIDQGRGMRINLEHQGVFEKPARPTR